MMKFSEVRVHVNTKEDSFELLFSSSSVQVVTRQLLPLCVRGAPEVKSSCWAGFQPSHGIDSLHRYLGCLM